MAQSLANKVVIITGASSGIGAATARYLAEQGCKLTLAARSREKLEALAAELRTETLVVATDVSKAQELKAMVEQTLEAFGRIDVLFANAGIYIAGEVAEGNPEEWEKLMDTNVQGVFRSVHEVLPYMIEQKSGDILVTSSISGCIDIPWEPIYSASKHAIQGFVHTLRRQLAVYNIRVGAVAPGKVANELWGFKDEGAIAQELSQYTSLRSEDVAEAVVFMLSRPAHVTIRDLLILPQKQDL